MFKFLFPIPHDIELTSPQYSRYQFIYLFTTLSIVALIYYLFFGISGEHQNILAVVESISIVILFFIQFHLRLKQDISTASNYFVLLTFIMLFAVTYFTPGEEYVYLWNITFPLLAFYLLSYKKGALITLIFYAVFFSYILNITPEIITPIGTENIIISFTLIAIGLFMSERSKAYNNSKLEKLRQREYQYNLELEKLSSIDKLTQIFNRSKLDELLDFMHQRAHRYQENFSVIILDIDYFKSVNDTHGHLVGDKILIDFSKLISDNIRSSDIFGRWGGEEFLLILPNSSQDEAVQMAEHLRALIELHDFHYHFSNSASFGIATYHNEDNVISLLNRADKALYTAKDSGRNCVKTD